MAETKKHIYFLHFLDLMRLIYAVLILLLALMTSAQCQKTAEEWYDEGFALYRQGGHLTDALYCFEQVLSLAPDANTWNIKGSILSSLGNESGALTCYDEAIRMDPNYELAWYNKGSVLDKQGKYYEAIVAYDEAIRLDPNDAYAWNNKGVALEALGNTTEADAAFAKAKELGYTG